MLYRSIQLSLVFLLSLDIYAMEPNLFKPLKGPRDSSKASGARVSFQVDTKYKSKISPWIYGANTIGTFKTPDPKLNLSFYRLGGNRLSAYNWENNISHAGSDYRYQNDRWLCSLLEVADCSKPGAVVESFVNKSFKANAAAVLLTVPILDHVALKGSKGEVCEDGITKSYECAGRKHLKTKFARSLPQKKGKLQLKPDASDAYVYQDEFVHWVRNRFQSQLGQGKKIFFSMDNEPALWGSTHNRVRPGGKYCKHNPTYTELLKRNIDYAKSVKSQMNTLVFGPVHYGWMGMSSLQNFKSCTGHSEPFYQFFMQGVKNKTYKGQNLVDVYDIHWYPEIHSNGKNGHRITGSNTSPATNKVRVQAPRSWWDKGFNEKSWISKDALGENVALFPRMHSWTQKYNPNMGLAITEYTFGGEHHISGGIAQADALGIMAREGIFAATFWPLAPSGSNSDFVKGAFKMYRNYDGKGSVFGSTLVSARSNSIIKSSIYASLRGKQMIIVAINRSEQKISGTFDIKHNRNFKSIKSFQLTAKSSNPQPSQKAKLVSGKRVVYQLPAMSVSTLELTP